MDVLLEHYLNVYFRTLIVRNLDVLLKPFLNVLLEHWRNVFQTIFVNLISMFFKTLIERILDVLFKPFPNVFSVPWLNVIQNLFWTFFWSIDWTCSKRIIMFFKTSITFCFGRFYCRTMTFSFQNWLDFGGMSNRHLFTNLNLCIPLESFVWKVFKLSKKPLKWIQF